MIKGKLTSLICKAVYKAYTILTLTVLRFLGEKIPREGQESKRLRLANFTKEGVYNKYQKNWKFVNWPLKSVCGLRSYTVDELEKLRAALEKDTVTLTEIIDEE